jgi:hypothetical protein
MSLDSAGLFNSLVSHALSLGIFETVNSHEPENPPGSGVTCAVTLGSVDVVANASGLAAVTGRVTFMVRVYNPGLGQPYDAIDPTVLSAIDVLYGAYAGAFTLGGTVRDIDLLGQHGVALSAKLGWVRPGGKLCRSVDITVPVIINDLWSEVP